MGFLELRQARGIFSSLVAVCDIFTCGIWDLVPQPGIEPRTPCIGSVEP